MIIIRGEYLKVPGVLRAGCVGVVRMEGWNVVWLEFMI